MNSCDRCPGGADLQRRGNMLCDPGETLISTRSRKGAAYHGGGAKAH